MYPATVTTEEQKRRDNDQIKLLAIFHFILSVLALFGIPMLFLHYFFMRRLFLNPEMWKSQPGGVALPKEMMSLFICMYLVLAVIFIIVSLLNLLSGFFLWRRKHRMFSLVVAGIDCLQVPFGTALGVFTLVILQRESVKGLYGEDELS